MISIITFASEYIGAVTAIRVEDYHPKGKRWWVCLPEKGGWRQEMPAHNTHEAYLISYIEAIEAARRQARYARPCRFATPSARPASPLILKPARR